MGNLVEVLGKSDKLKGVTDAMKIAGLVDLLSEDGPYTVLAPNDEAIAQVPRSYFNALLENHVRLVRGVKYHVIKGEITSKDIEEMLEGKEALEIETLSGDKVTFNSSGDLKVHYTVNNATIVSMDLRADNGVIHTIDKVLFADGGPEY